jgi:phosphatidylserine/phosphatidylglycerophosphate/cardiolipin synthase-like enzyme
MAGSRASTSRSSTSRARAGATRSASSSPARSTTSGVERSIRAKLLVDGDHYEDLVARAIAGANVSVWISTANLKTMLVEAPIGSRARARGRYVSFFEALGDLARRGVDVRILHASPPSGPLAREMARLGASATSRSTSAVKMRRCPRVHLKMIAIDGRLLYLGSANLTGAGLGAKGEGRRNFEMGIVTDSDAMLDASQERFDRIWRGTECASCKLRSACDAPIDLLVRRRNDENDAPVVRRRNDKNDATVVRRRNDKNDATVVRRRAATRAGQPTGTGTPAAEATSRGSSPRRRRSPSSPR